MSSESIESIILVYKEGVWPSALTQEDLVAARALLRDPKITVEDAERRFCKYPLLLFIATYPEERVLLMNIHILIKVILIP
ncbi:hypothetical protein NF27_BA00030 [Candidatus Jidaibacter acanthamoeba]|uniref:Uncharacterized protein n=1 Tax=Candidatus Jidaibacter acanthamoebae TaxID=86105 RepID=A0A0C1R1S6_9RICK|nr:hypothetical protein [Candidatus Jidaibacter acanthamoeba]KIE06220.1 hypothetical protein NF27_BA00030 [Candidatus Jidaibacter acanthamoeba]